ncbi:HAMP domain-containing protein [Cryobacterium sp. TMN-39-2]|uniref:histidine kinase n=1 Tax=Cryobacterium zongtaii TaxID=1259217 RepID=A0A2S3ZFS6_9MICO|nr:two-component sensor histidine kinase [Cryobacterium zongtaii]POH65972.1 two-component sensor histidine kinase [Cryobacterium zongtaii]TFC46293.1 HAMP domain-containing protein [Cryobacterium sp. TMN-39-2]
MSRTRTRVPGPRDLSARLLGAILVVVLVGVATAWVVVAGIGPAIFHVHMMGTGGSGADSTVHAEEAFRTASTLSLALALIAALAASVGVSLFLSRRITRSLAPVTEAAGRVADGDYTARIPAVGLGSEFDDLTSAFNSMATDLGRIEATRTRMLGDLAHEMRTPITTIGAYLEAIADGVQEADPATLTMLGDQVTRLARLSQDVAIVTTAEEGRLTMHRRRLLVSQVVADAVAQATAQYAAQNVTLTVTMSGAARGAAVDGDSDRIGQVLTNLLDNAVRHTPSGGEVVISAAVVGGRAVVAVSDEGDGIPADHILHVFERFYRVDASRDRAHGGSGVGLAIAKSITEAHGGSVRADSAGVGRGATFTVELPLLSQNH